MKGSDCSKRAVGVAAANLVENGMTIGIGSGSTASCFIAALIKRVETEGLHFRAVATSLASHTQAQQGGIQVLDINEVKGLDLAIDGADEIDAYKQMVKGGGGALLREKIIASIAHEMVVIVDESKLVDHLGTFGLPLEILPFGFSHTLRAIEQKKFKVSLRVNGANKPLLTDNGNYIADISFSEPIEDPEPIDYTLLKIPGVLETGFFLGLAGRIFVGKTDGTIEIRP
ncbi:MAG: ribose-5-phosphate isomerase RpiA [Verrucomicrobia bacterium]|nr:ribose-5-phosphate isomerase RpiA [Verrucomicrobiota bacterium]